MSIDISVRGLRDIDGSLGKMRAAIKAMEDSAENSEFPLPEAVQNALDRYYAEAGFPQSEIDGVSRVYGEGYSATIIDISKLSKDIKFLHVIQSY